MLTTNISFKLEFSESNGVMSVSINGTNVTPDSGSNVVFLQEVILPSQIEILLTGKSLKDTVLDEKGNILIDKYVKLSNMSIGNIPINKSLLFNICEYTPDGELESIKDTFYAFNGKVLINIDEDDFIKWHLKQDNKFTL